MLMDMMMDIWFDHVLVIMRNNLKVGVSPYPRVYHYNFLC
jgi:hypothetical protein